MMCWQNWFFEEADTPTVKPLEELMGLYYLSVGRGANLLINIGPDRRGLLPDADCVALLVFGDEIRRRFAIHVQTSPHRPLLTRYEGRNIGHKAICRSPLIACRKVVVEITAADRPVLLRSITLHNTTDLRHQH